MKRRLFLQGLFAIVAAPVVAKSIEPEFKYYNEFPDNSASEKAFEAAFAELGGLEVEAKPSMLILPKDRYAEELRALNAVIKESQRRGVPEGFRIRMFTTKDLIRN